MKRLIYFIASVMLLAACGKTVDLAEMYEVTKREEAQQSTVNIEVMTIERYGESELKKIIIDASSKYDQNKVNGIRINIIDSDNKHYADAKIAFNETGMNATGAKKKNISEIDIK